MEHEYTNEHNSGKKIIKLFLGTVAGCITALPTALILSLIMTINAVPDSMIYGASLITLAVSAFICGFATVRLIGSKGLVHGALSGVLFFAVQMSFGLIFADSHIIMNVLIALFIDTALAAIGGITAVNTGK